MPTSLSIASGKGGVGKTTLAINLAIMQAKISNCLLLDADMGMANAHILLGINPDLTIKDFFDGSCSLEKVITNGPEKLKFISGGSGITEMLNVDKNKKLNFIRSFDQLSTKIDSLIVDVSAGAEDSSLSLLSASDKILIVLINEPTSFTDAFTLIKVCHLEFGLNEFCLAVNMANNQIHGNEVYSKFNKVIRRFYDVNITFVGSIPKNSKIQKSVIQKKPLILDKTNKDFYLLFDKMMTKINNAPKNKFEGIKFFNNTIDK
ncbi:MAG: hypothetical protein CMJ08_01930 [Pelagibacterales bacterium]|mgnify:CR=1 FL=1|nr:hypothetical protein [Pelagibacterales bacterium]|tara:strand:- start:9623 stop:10408 length:786 start_codon:yes stop_codon:yes gene_type:complete